MNQARRHSGARPPRRWWTLPVRLLAVRLLTLVLALALFAPGPGHDADAHRQGAQELSMASAADESGAQERHGCPACATACGCHLALDTADGIAPPATAAQPAARWPLVVALTSVPSDRLPRPPRA